MRRRFSRKRRGSGSGDGGATPIDAARLLGRIADEDIVPVPALDVLEHDDIAVSYAAVGTGEQADGTRLIVSFSPTSAGDALLAALATGARLAEDAGFEGQLVAVAPQWSTAARRRLGLQTGSSMPVRAVAAAQLGESAGAGFSVAAEPTAAPAVLSLQSVAAQLSDAADRELFSRAAAALEGLASKHGGAVRGCGNVVELVLLARRVAELRASESGIELLTLLPQRSSAVLSSDVLAEALDGLEGQLRRRLSDRRTRDGEEGMRSRVIPVLASACGLRATSAWPLGGADEETIDLIGVDSSGAVVVGAIREELGLVQLGAILDATLALQPALPTLLSGVDAPVKLGTSRLVLAARSFAPAATRALSAIGIGYEIFEVRAPRGRGFEVAALASGAEARRPQPEPRSGDREAADADRSDGRGPRRRSRRPRSDRGNGTDAEGVGAKSEAEGGVGADAETPRTGSRRGRRSGGRGRGRSGVVARSAEGGSDEASPEGSRDAPRVASVPRFDELSSFDLDDEGSMQAEGLRSPRRGRPRRRGRRGRRSTGGGGDEDAGVSEGESVRPEREAGGGVGGEVDGGVDGDRPRIAQARGADRANGDESLISEDEDGELASLAALPDEVAELGIAEPAYDEEEDLGDDADAAEHAAVVERELRRRARLAKAEPEPPPRPPRRRAVIVAHADRDSLMAAIVLARDVRLLEGMWVYPQADLMTFFRSVTTDLREDTPIYVVGFTPSPSRDVLQAAGLYSDRLVWFDHHEWPPEDIGGLKQSVGEDSVHLQQGAGSSLPVVLSTCTRRSRFSDKLVDLAAGRFTLHDYERWGRLWWSRLGEIAAKPGEVRSAVEPLLVGRPSDLAREAARAPTPELPRELDYVSRRDFRLVHFAGYSLVVVDVEPGLDLHLAARIARERHDALLSLSYEQGDSLLILAGDELAGHRSLDFGAVVEHLAAKFQWLDPQADDDHVARVRIRDFAEHPERLDEVVGAIAMGRSILER